MANDDLDGARTRIHSQRDMAQANAEVIDLLVKLAHAHGWPIKETLSGFRDIVDQTDAGPELRQAYKDRFAVLLDGLN
jgi:hypothetical protein